MNVRAKVTVTATAALMALAACASGGDGSKPAAPAGPKLPHDGAPKVTNPITDTSKISADPCSVLSASDKTALHVGDVTPKPHGMDGDGCEFAATGDNLGGVHAVLVNSKAGGPTQGLSTLFANAKADGTTLKTVGPYAGHPAVEAPIKGDPNSCVVTIGLSDQLAYSVTYGSTQKDQSFGSGTPCQKAEKFASTIMKNITQGG